MHTLASKHTKSTVHLFQNIYIQKIYLYIYTHPRCVITLVVYLLAVKVTALKTVMRRLLPHNKIHEKILTQMLFESEALIPVVQASSRMPE